MKLQNLGSADSSLIFIIYTILIVKLNLDQDL